MLCRAPAQACHTSGILTFTANIAACATAISTAEKLYAEYIKATSENPKKINREDCKGKNYNAFGSWRNLFFAFFEVKKNSFQRRP